MVKEDNGLAKVWPLAVDPFIDPRRKTDHASL
jgi:hypothetical protein